MMSMIESKDKMIVPNRIDFMMRDSIEEWKESKIDGQMNKQKRLNNRIKDNIIKKY